MTQPGRDALLAVLVRRQAGAFSASQAREVGFSKATITRRVGAGTWTRVFPGVYRIAGPEPSRLGALWAAWLAAGPAAHVTHESSALSHGAERLPDAPVTLTTPHRWHHRLEGVVVHQIDDLLLPHRTRKHGLPMSTPARSVVELAATQSAATIGRVADDLIAARVTSVGAIAAVFAQVVRPGKPGMRKLAVVLGERSGDYVPPASELERALFAALSAGGLPSPDRQVRLPGRGAKGIVDAAYRDARIVIEADGRRWHDRVHAARADRERDAAVVRAGWVPLRFVYEQVVGAPAEVCAVVADTRAVRLDLLGRAA